MPAGYRGPDEAGRLEPNEGETVMRTIRRGLRSRAQIRPRIPRKITRTAVGAALVAALADLQQSGHTVAVLSSAAAQALSSADIGLGVMPNSDAEPPPWMADLILTDLAGAWRVLHALPAAKTQPPGRWLRRSPGRSPLIT